MSDARRALQASLGLAAAWTLAASLGAFEPLERLTVRARYLARPVPGFTAPVTVIAIDERSLAAHGKMPWPRETFADLVDRVRARGARVVGIDVAFNEPAEDPRADARLARAIAAVPTVLPTFLAYAGAAGGRMTAIAPIPVLRDAAVGQGSVQLATYQQAEPWELQPYQNALGEPDAAPLARGETRERVPAFAMAVAHAYAGDTWSPALPGGPWAAEPLLLNYRGPAGTAPTLSAADVLRAAGAERDLAGRIVLIGATAAGLPDTNFVAPDLRNGPMSGVEISATAVDNLLGGGFWRRLGGPAFALLFLLLALGPGRALLAGAAPGGRRHLVWAGATGLWLVAAFAAFSFGVWLEVVPVVGFLFTCHFLGLLGERRTLLESRARLMERYASDLARESQRQRERVEGELHDGVQQLLVALGRELRQVRKALGVVPVAAGPGEPAGHGAARALDRLERAEGLTEDVRQEILRVRADLLPPALRHEGLAGALPVLAHEAAKRHGFQARVELGEWAPLPQEQEVEVYWLVQEALNNVAKHAEATHVTIRLGHEADRAVVEVADDGRGFRPPDLAVPPAGTAQSGLHRMWLRMRGRGGDLTIEARPGGGARLRFLLPRAAAPERPFR